MNLLYKFQIFFRAFVLLTIVLLPGVFLPGTVLASFKIPGSLNESDQKSILGLLGPATAARLLSAPYPLGGSEGFLVGFGHQFVPTGEINEFGSKTEISKDSSFPVLTLGKGLFNDVDMFVNAIPFTSRSDYSHFSAQTRLGIWYSLSAPVFISTVVHAATTNLKNQIQFQNYGIDALVTMYLKKICFFTGLGSLYANGTFVGGPFGITATGQTETVRQNFYHRIVGVDFRWNSYFIAAQVDSYDRPYYATQIGYRF